MSIQYKWLEITTSHLHLEEKEWKDMIEQHIETIEMKPIGSILINRIKHYMKMGCVVTISNAMKETSIYPKTVYHSPIHVEVVIPNVPYFIKVHTFSQYKRFSEIMSYMIILAHELIHCLRWFEGMIDSNDMCDDEDATIHGMNGGTLKIHNIVITENTIRMEHHMNQRVSHNSKEVYCYNVKSTYCNANKFTKDNFYV
jgi:hypothetical protein